jgi:hypothetical protein
MNVVGRGGLARPICGKHKFNVTNKGSMPRGSMFTRDSTTGHAPLEPVAGARPARPPSAHVQSAEAGKSVISNDLRIIGQSLKIISRGTLQVDGESRATWAAPRSSSARRAG